MSPGLTIWPHDHEAVSLLGAEAEVARLTARLEQAEATLARVRPLAARMRADLARYPPITVNQIEAGKVLALTYWLRELARALGKQP